MTNYIYIWFDQFATNHFFGGLLLLATLASIPIAIIMTELAVKKQRVLCLLFLLISMLIVEILMSIIMTNYYIN